jgi:hypothetical protein
MMLGFLANGVRKGLFYRRLRPTADNVAAGMRFVNRHLLGQS